MSDCHHPPQQQAGKSPGFQTQGRRPTPRVRQDFRMQPAPHIAPDHGHADKQPPQDRVPAAGAEACWMHLPLGRCNAKPPARGGANPTQGALRAPPGGIQEGRTLVPPPLAPRVVTDHRQVKGDGALVRTLHGLGGPVAVLCGRQRIGPGRSPPFWGRFLIHDGTTSYQR
jgi:hypothetical protein